MLVKPFKKNPSSVIVIPFQSSASGVVHHQSHFLLFFFDNFGWFSQSSFFLFFFFLSSCCEVTFLLLSVMLAYTFTAMKRVNMSYLMIKPTRWSVRTVKTQISLGIRPVWSEPSQCAKCVAEDPKLIHADSEDTDQTGRMLRLIWVFAGRTDHFADFGMRRLISSRICCREQDMAFARMTEF